MIGVDTNVVLRVFDRGALDQTAATENLLEREGEHGCLVNPIVLAEFVWTLDRSYRLDRATIADHLDRLLQGSEFLVPFAEEAVAAVDQYRKGSADFADYFLSEINRSLGCRTTMTFDRDAARGKHFTLLKV